LYLKKPVCNQLDSTCISHTHTDQTSNRQTEVSSSPVIKDQLFPTSQLAEETCWRQPTDEAQLQVVLNSIKTAVPTVLQSHSPQLQVQFYYIIKEWSTQTWEFKNGKGSNILLN